MTPNEASGKERGDEGFTLLETLVEVLLVSLALGVLAFLAVVTFDGWTKTSAVVEDRASRELFLAALDQAADRIAVPFYGDPEWGRDLRPAAEGRPLKIPWYRGNPGAFLELGTDGHRVWLRGWDADFSLSMDEASFAPLVDRGRVVGVEFSSRGRSHPAWFAATPAPGAGDR